jgi:DNA-binding transcriptional ArsR family regulator
MLGVGPLDEHELDASVVVDGLGALAHETRLAVFSLLVRKGARGESAGELARRLAVPPQTLSFHVKELVRAGLVRGRREGRNIFYSVDFDHAQRLVAYLGDSCCAEAGSPPVERPRPRKKEAFR